MENFPLKNYFDLLIDPKIDDVTDCPVCITGIAHIINEIYIDLTKHSQEGKFQELLKKNSLYNIYSWKNNIYPIPIWKIKQLLLFWKNACNKSESEYTQLYNRMFQEATYFKAKCSPVNIKIIKSIDTKLAYLLGIIYADGALRNIWLTFKNEKRFRWEITVTEELESNLETIIPLLEEIFGIKTNVKTVCSGRWYRILFQSMIFFRILNNLFEMPMGYKKGKLKIPSLLKEAPFEIKKYFVSGFFDGDGWCSILNTKKKFTSVVAVSQSSKEILEDLNDVLKEAGLNFKLNNKKRGQYIWYDLITKSKKQIKLFQNEFNFYYPNKRERLKVLVDSF